MQPEPLIECKYGWGRVLRLYRDCLDLHGTSHALSELIFVRPIYRQVLGVSSACIELRFRRKKIVIRGIASLDDAQAIVAHLKDACAAISSINRVAPISSISPTPPKSYEQSLPGSAISPTPAPSASVPGEANDSLHGVNWQQTYYTIENAEVETPGDSSPTLRDGLPHLDPLALRSLGDWQPSAYASRELSSDHPYAVRKDLSSDLQRGHPQGGHSGNPNAVSKDLLAPISPDAITVSIPVVAPNWRRERQLVRERRRRRLKPPRSNQPQDFDGEKLAQHLQQPELPHIAVPTRLLPGEHAHYRTDATLCHSDKSLRTAVGLSLLGEPTSSRYLAKDYGSLIFTNKRLIYIGRKSQFVLCYERLVHVSRLRGALAFLAEHWPNRQVCEVPQPLEAAMYLENILQRFHGHFQPAPVEEDFWQQPRDTPHDRPDNPQRRPDNREGLSLLTIEEIDTIRFPSQGWTPLEPVEHGQGDFRSW